jgi:hypothetical protein
LRRRVFDGILIVVIQNEQQVGDPSEDTANENQYRCHMGKESATSGSTAWDQLRDAVAKEPQLRTEIEWLMRLSVETYNPSDRGVRFVTGSIGEWMVAFAAYAAEVLTLPDGHNANSHDLRGLLGQAKDLWSVKSSYSSGGSFGISNGRDGPGSGMVGPIIFWSPEFPGLVYVDPEIHADVKAAQVAKSDQMQLPKSVVLKHAKAHPECVIECKIPENPGTATRDPGFESVRLLVESGPFRRLRKMLDDVHEASDSSVVAQLRQLQVMRDKGDLSPSLYEAAVRKVTGV